MEKGKAAHSSILGHKEEVAKQLHSIQINTYKWLYSFYLNYIHAIYTYINRLY